MKLRGTLWTLGMAYTGFVLTGQGLRTFNNLSVSEGLLGGIMGFLLAIMFTLREQRRERAVLIEHSIAEYVPSWGISRENRDSHRKIKQRSIQTDRPL